MDVAEIEKWLRDAHQKTATILELDQDWWPMTAGQGEGRASAWATAFFALAALDRCSGPILEAARNKGTGDVNLNVINALWTSAPNRTYSQYEVLVDFAVHNWDAASPVQLTGESEMHAQYDVGDSMEGADNYAWDFYKLLVIPSTTRLFAARVGGKVGETAGQRCQRLASTLSGLIDWYGPALLRPHDELGAVIIPSAKGQHASTIIMWLDRGRLRYKTISNPVLP